MVEYDKIYNSDNRGICGVLADSIGNKLNKMWQMQERHNREHGVGFAIKGNVVHTSEIIQGDQTSIKVSDMERMIEKALQDSPHKYDHIGQVHTHPIGDKYLSHVLSPQDYIAHMKTMDKMQHYDTSLILTNAGAFNKLFGITSTHTKYYREDYLGQIAKLSGDILNAQMMDKNPFEIMAEIEDLALEFSEHCSVDV